MRFWDSSAIIPLLVGETSSEWARQTYTQDAGLLIWWATPVECASALARYERDPGLSGSSAIAEAFMRLGRLMEYSQFVEPVDEVRRIALRVLRMHPLRAADSLQLAAALLAAGNEPTQLGFVCADSKLIAAAAREGFNVTSPGKS